MHFCACNIVAFLPIFLLVWIVGGIFVTYGISTSLNHTIAFWPPISLTGDEPPESSVFSSIFNIASALFAAIIWIKYCHVRLYRAQFRPGKVVERLNCISLGLGFIAAFGIFLVANIQLSSWELGHNLGAQLAFFVGAVYIWSQVAITYLARPDQTAGKRSIALMRFLLALLCSALLVCLQVFSSYLFGSESEEEFYYYLTWVGLFQWPMVITFLVIFATFSYELRSIEFHLEKAVECRSTAQSQDVHSPVLINEENAGQ